VSILAEVVSVRNGVELKQKKADLSDAAACAT